MSPIAHIATDRDRSMRSYRIRRTIRFFAILLLGIAVAYAEHAQWLPPICTGLVKVEQITPQGVVGPCIFQTMVIPVAFLLGVNSTTYFYTSRPCFFVFWLLHGVDLLPALLYSPVSLIPLSGILVVMLTLISRCDTVAAAGIRTRHVPAGLALHCYFGTLLRLWGALLICQFLFYTILTRML